MHPGSSALHPLLCGGSTTSNLLPFSSDQRHSPAAESGCTVSSPGAQSLEGAAAAAAKAPGSQQAADLTNRREPLPWCGPTGAQVRWRGTGAATPGAAKGSVRTILGPNLLSRPFLAQICLNFSSFFPSKTLFFIFDSVFIFLARRLV